MFETLFVYPGVRARHEEGPFTEARKRFLKYSAEQGMARATLLRIARELLVVAERLDVGRGTTFCLPEIEAAANRWACEQRRRHRVEQVRWSQGLFVQTAVNWLRFLGILKVPAPALTPGADLLAKFATYGIAERGLSAVTIRNRCWHVQKFLEWLTAQNRSFVDVCLQDVHTFLAGRGQQGWSRVSVASSAKALRAFFCYAAQQGHYPANLAAGIDSPRLFRHEGLPTGPTWPDVQRLIAATDGDRGRDIRDRAILMLLAVYGLRSGEVSKLCLEDVDWERNQLTVRRSKQRRVQQYPLVTGVGEAILRYLQQVRPRGSHRELFLTLKAPFHPLSAGGLYDLVSSRLSQLAIPAPRRGPHALRHACAQHLVAEGFSLKQIGDHLGHRSTDATRIYAKVDLSGLREVADFPLGGLV